MVVDLSHTDLALTVPAVSDGRFYVFPFYDVYGNNFANIGSVTNTAPGTYLLRLGGQDRGPPGLHLLSDVASAEARPGYAGIVNFPTTYGSVIIRILLRNNSTDVAAVQHLRSQIQVTPVARADAESQAPALSLEGLNGSLSGSPEERALQRTARLYPYNLPEPGNELGNVSAILDLAGLQNGSYTQPPGVNLTAANDDARRRMAETFSDPANRQDLGNNWTQPLPSLSGNYGPNYFARANVARTGYLELVASQALYPAYVGESETATLVVKAGEAIILTFSAKPPVTAFWSLTAYGANQFLIPNPMNIYSLGDRSNLTFADGFLVYGNATSDGPFQILIQPANTTPPQNWTRK
ncbi:MAG: hypothetical protein M1838_001095 [Thelocarpon superellum]|nr:MAG: hypothetical protein M1838_001095 [Thelocarpon superellum]